MNEYKNIFENGLNDFQKATHQCLAELLKHDPTVYLATGFNALLTTHFPSIIKAYGTQTTLLEGLKYIFSVSDLITYNAPTTNSDCFDFGITQCVIVTGNLTLSVIPLILEGKKEPDIISKVRTTIFKLPITLGRNLLYTPAFDDQDLQTQWLPSGTIICHGKLRCLPPIKVMRNNTMLLIRKKEFVKLQIRSAHHAKPFRNTSSLDFIIMNTNKKSSLEGIVSCALPFANRAIHIGVLAQALGCPPKVFILFMKAMMGNLYNPIVFLPYEISLLYDSEVLKAIDQETATIMISKLFNKSRHSTGLNQVKTEVFPHLNIGFDDEIIDVDALHRLKLLYLTRCTGLVILFAAKKIEETPRDFFRYSSIVTPAHYIGSLVRKLFITHMKTRQKLLRRALMKMFSKDSKQQNFIDLVKLFGEPLLSSRIVSPIANGSWGPTSKGVTISLHSGNPDGFISELTKFCSSLQKTGSNDTEPRQVQMDGFGGVCGSTSPDGENVGLTMQLACLATITIDFEQPKILADLLEILFQDFLIPINEIFGEALDKAFIQSKCGLQEKGETKINFERLQNGNFYAYYNNCGIHSHYLPFDLLDTFIAKFRKLRRNGNIPQFTFLEKYDIRKEIHIMNMGGQIIRPLIVVENLHLLKKANMSFFDLLSMGIIEYVNAAEEQTICFAAVCYDDYLHSLNNQNETRKVTHIDLTEGVFVSQQVATVPFLTSQHGPRTAYFASQVKQKMTADIKKQWGTVLNTQLSYAFQSLTRTLNGFHIPSLSLGRDQPLVMAFFADKNQDDALIFGKAPIERGMENAFTTRYYSSDASPQGTTQYCKEEFIKPNEILSRKDNDYSTVANDGIPLKNTYIVGGGLVIAKIKTTRIQLSNTDNQKQIAKSVLKTKDISTSSKMDESGIVTQTSKYSTPQGEKVTVGITTPRIPIVGDKFSTRFSGKGVVSYIESQENMIYSIETGQSPDISVAPASISSRMTLSSLLEKITGKTVAISGDMSKGIDFHQYSIGNANKIDELGTILHKFGFSSNGFETYIHGKTGKLLRSRIFTGIVDVARLVHLANKKLHSRDFGPRDPATRQPRNGRLNGGGLRIGEMERDVLNSHGASYNIEARLKDLSDPFWVHICSKCKMLAEGNEEINYTWCRSCTSKKHIYLVSIPFTFLVAITELTAMGIVVRIAVQPDDMLLKKKQPIYCEDVWLPLFDSKNYSFFSSSSEEQEVEEDSSPSPSFS